MLVPHTHYCHPVTYKLEPLTSYGLQAFKKSTQETMKTRKYRHLHGIANRSIISLLRSFVTCSSYSDHTENENEKVLYQLIETGVQESPQIQHNFGCCPRWYHHKTFHCSLNWKKMVDRLSKLTNINWIYQRIDSNQNEGSK